MSETDIIILNHMTEGMVITNPEGEVLFFNEVAGNYKVVLNHPLQKGKSLLDIISPSRRDLVTTILEEVNQKKKPRITEAEYKLPDGIPNFFEVTYSPVLDEAKELTSICIVSRDITPQKTFERKTNELLRELQNLIEHANAVIVGVDTSGYITEWNQESIRLTGYDKPDVFAQPIVSLVGENEAMLLENLLQAVSKQIPVSSFEMRITTRQGHLVTLLLNATPRLNASGNVIGVLFMGQDITELSDYRYSLEQKVEDRTRELREALRKEKELVEMKNRFVSIASHEFRVPLAAIRSAVHTLKTGTQSKNDEAQKLESIDRQVEHMNVLLEDVLTIGRNTHSLTATISPINLIDFLNTIMEEVSANARHSHRIMTELPVQPIIVRSDERLLRNIFINLLTNAMKFSPGKEEIHVLATPDTMGVSICVRDFGIGIAPAELQKIFEPFTRGSNTANIAGTGLGLSIVRKAVDTLGGEISVQSIPGIETTFTVYLRF
ncbi:MAG TPA: ATP-binding protein [Ohtaekwangia sp.]